VKNTSARELDSAKYRAVLALILIVPATSIGSIMSLLIAPGIIGQLVAVSCGIWMVCLPVVWCKFIDRDRPQFNLDKTDSLAIGVWLGIAMFAIILTSYWGGGNSLLDITDIRARAQQTRVNIPLMVFGFGTFQTLINSLVEEYVWRWFVYQKCEVLVKKSLAVYLSALFFTLHHIILIAAHVDDWRLVTALAIAVFIAGVCWAKCFQIYRSLLPIYISHMIADLALQIVSWDILLR
jgi:uncharacterized protein